MKRLLDVLSCSLAVLVLLPFGLVVALCIVLGSRGGAFYRQRRVGRGGKEFGLLKFRTMRQDADRQGPLITIGDDRRITRIGRFLRKYKIDELPQLLNIIAGDMSVVGPRPEVPKYVALYDERQRRVLSVRPGLTDYASLKYIAESELLAQSDDPERTYIEEVMPAKLELNLQYIENQSVKEDIVLILKTLRAIVGRRGE
ncbi:MAG: sugar transferase [Bacteroidales bacterium]|nr:sugar transferase [Bacteroidales bacterium]MCR5115070.1 sugar transferase [Bacteroidales bacterium]